MYSLLSIILLLSGIIIGVVVIRGASKQQPDLFSMRNLFLAGLLVFQYTSGIIALLLPDQYNPYAIADRRIPGLKYTFLLILFTLAFFAIYRSGFIARRIVSFTKARQIHANWMTLLTLSVTFFLLGLLCRFALVYIPYVGIYTFQLGATFFALSAGLAAWAWMPRLFNPLPMIVSAVVVLGGLAVFFSDSFGRRDILGLGLAFIWGAYHSQWQYMPFRKLIIRFALMATVGLVFLSAYTSTRYSLGGKIESLGDRVRVLAEADMKQGLADLFSGQHAASYSMYFLDTRPHVIEYDTLHSIKLFFVLPYPRSMWPEKPDALALTSVSEINDAGRPKGWNIGPGLVGHMANDNPFIALPLYALILAVFLRFTDEMITKHSRDPFVVLPMGVALGQVIAIPRGELATFFGKTLLYLVAGWIAMQIVSRALQLFSPNKDKAMPIPDYDSDCGDPQYDPEEYDSYHSDSHHDATYPY